VSLFRNFRNVRPLDYIDDNHFVGTVEWHHPHADKTRKFACYGWSKGGSFFVYTIENGQIEKLGTVKRFELG
jgi:hypothetical protein